MPASPAGAPQTTGCSNSGDDNGNCTSGLFEVLPTPTVSNDSMSYPTVATNSPPLGSRLQPDCSTQIARHHDPLRPVSLMQLQSPTTGNDSMSSLSSFPNSTKKKRPPSLFSSMTSMSPLATSKLAASSPQHLPCAACNEELPATTPFHCGPTSATLRTDPSTGGALLSSSGAPSPGVMSRLCSPRLTSSTPSSASITVALSLDLRTLIVGKYVVSREGCTTLRNHLLVNAALAPTSFATGIRNGSGLLPLPDPSATPPLKSTLMEEPLSPIAYSLDAFPMSLLPPSSIACAAAPVQNGSMTSSQLGEETLIATGGSLNSGGSVNVAPAAATCSGVVRIGSSPIDGAASSCTTNPQVLTPMLGATRRVNSMIGNRGGDACSGSYCINYKDLTISESPFEAGASASVHEAIIQCGPAKGRRLAVKRIRMQSLFPFLETMWEGSPTVQRPPLMTAAHPLSGPHTPADSIVASGPLLSTLQQQQQPSAHPMMEAITSPITGTTGIGSSEPYYVALRCLPKHRQLHSILHRELYMLHSEYRSAHVVKVYNAFFVPERCSLDIVMEFMDYGCLDKLVRLEGCAALAPSTPDGPDLCAVLHVPSHPNAHSNSGGAGVYDHENHSDRDSSDSELSQCSACAESRYNSSRRFTQVPGVSVSAEATCRFNEELVEISPRHSPLECKGSAGGEDDVPFISVAQQPTLPPDVSSAYGHGGPLDGISPRAASGSTSLSGSAATTSRFFAVETQSESLDGTGIVTEATAEDTTRRGRRCRRCRQRQQLASQRAVTPAPQQAEAPHQPSTNEAYICKQSHTSTPTPTPPRMLLPERVLAIVAEQVLRGIEDMHRRGHVHRDIKPQNILVNRFGVVKLSDFGLVECVADGLTAQSSVKVDPCASSEEAAEDASAPLCSGTDRYMSPERHRGEPHGKPSDIWAFGITLAECALGRYPVDLSNCADEFERLDRMKHVNFRDAIAQTERLREEQRVAAAPFIPLGNPASSSRSPGSLGTTATLGKLSEVCIDFIQSCVDPDPSRRPTAQQLQSHRFLTQWEDSFDFGACINKMRRKEMLKFRHQVSVVTASPFSAPPMKSAATIDEVIFDRDGLHRLSQMVVATCVQ